MFLRPHRKLVFQSFESITRITSIYISGIAICFSIISWPNFWFGRRFLGSELDARKAIPCYRIFQAFASLFKLESVLVSDKKALTIEFICLV